MLASGRQATSFALIGGIGFIIDGGILTVLNSFFDVQLLPARIVSFSAAVTATWLLNRQRTFANSKSDRMAGEWGRYTAVNGIGSLLNMGIFFWLVARYEFLATWPLAALAIAASIALIFNFVASKYLVFTHSQS